MNTKDLEKEIEKLQKKSLRNFIFQVSLAISGIVLAITSLLLKAL